MKDLNIKNNLNNNESYFYSDSPSKRKMFEEVIEDVC